MQAMVITAYKDYEGLARMLTALSARALCFVHIDRKSEPFQLEVGDNYLEYDADENYTNLDVNLFYTPKYLGV